MSYFRRLRHQLEQSEGRKLSDWDISYALRIQPNTVRRLMHATRQEVRPSYLVAMLYLIKHSIDYVEALEHVGNEEMDALISRIEELGMGCSRIAFYLGIGSRQLRNLRGYSQTVPFCHYLAARYLLEHIEPQGPLETIEQHAELWAAA